MRRAIRLAALLLVAVAATAQNTPKPATTPVSPNAITQDLSHGARFTFTIGPKLSPYTFVVIPEPQDTDEWGNPHSTVRDIEVFRSDSKSPLQHLTGCNFTDMEAPPRGFDWFHTDDFNFDGYKDLYLLTSWGATGNSNGCVWLYNPATGHFDYNDSFSALAGYELNPADKTIVTFERGGMAGLIHHGEKYKVENNRPVLVWADSQDWDSGRFHCIVNEPRGGEMVATHDEWTDSENGDPACDDSKLFRPSAAQAAGSQQNPCEQQSTQLQLNECAAFQYRLADARLNRVYRKAMAYLTDELASAQKNKDEQQIEYVQTEITNLKSAERAWLTYRDLQCEAAGHSYEGGSMRPMIHAQCLKTLTEHRVADLKSVYEQGERKLE